MAEIRLEIEGAIGRLFIDNPGKLNCLSWAMMEDLSRHMDVIEESDALRVVVLSAAPARAFCAGALIDEWSALDAQGFSKRWVREGHRIFDRLAGLSVPTIGLIEAPVFGGGLELIAALDWRVFSPSATCALPETSIGIIPGWSGTQRLARLLPGGLLRSMALFGRVLDAEAVVQCGFGEVSDEPKARVEALMADCVARGPEANRLTKMMINAGAGENRDAIIEALGGGMAAASKDLRIGVEAFKNKKKPEF